MQKLWYLIVWLKRIRHCRGFGIQSPSDYWLVRYVINEHWPYYQYEMLGQDDGWLRRKLGRLYFRLANWLQPDMIVSDDYQDYLSAGCHKASFGETGSLYRLALTGDYQSKMASIYTIVLVLPLISIIVVLCYLTKKDIKETISLIFNLT